METELKRKYPMVLDLQMFAEEDPPAKLDMTQAELDAMIADRLARDRKKYADYDDVKTKLTALEQAEDERKKAAMTEVDRIKAEKDEAERKAADVAEAANKRIIRTEFRLAAKDAGIRSDAIDDAYLIADRTGITVDDNGNVAGIPEVVAALIASKPFLIEPKKSARDIGNGSGAGDEKPDKTKEQALAAAAEKARMSGRLEDRVAYAELKAQLGS